MAEPQLYRRRHNVVPRSARTDRPPSESTERPVRVAMLAPPWIPIPPPGYGGIEEVLELLCDALVDRGNDVTLFCAPGSTSKATVRALLPTAHPEAIERSLFEADHVARAFDAIDEAARTGEPFDLVHDHCGYTGLAMANRLLTPHVYTVHGPFAEDTSIFYDHHGWKTRMICISRSQASFAPAGANVVAVVYNPMDVDSWPFGLYKRDYLLWLGRFVPEKGPQRAIKVAQLSGSRLLLAGVVQPRFEQFFAKEIEPHIDGDQIQFVGEVGGARKQQLFADASAFLMPITWPEPFGMVMVESLAAGTPVLAFPNGAAPEIVEHGRNGFLVNNEEEMAAMVDRIGEIDPQECRESALRFSPDSIAAGYEAVYRETIDLARTSGTGAARAAAP